MRTWIRYVTGIVVALVLVLGGWQASIHLEGKIPKIVVSEEVRYLGPESALSVSFSDEGRGLRQITAFIEQNGKRQLLGGMNFPAPGTTQKTLRLAFDQPGLDPAEGPARLLFSAVDYSFRKNETSMVMDVVVDHTPPGISTMTSAHYINPGGSCLIVYRLSETVDTTGVMVNETFFPGYPFDPAEEQPRYAVLFSIPVDATGNTVKLGITARDRAGNEAFSTFHYHVRTKTFRDRTLDLSDRFLESLMPEFTSRIPALKNVSPLDAFIYVNEVLREENDREIQKICSRSEPRKLWEGRFLRMSNAATMAGFGDRRTYTYNGRPVTGSLHDGIDLASTINAVVEASNSGIVAYRGYLGIYGNMVVIDHGLGLFSFYAHLSSITVEKGECVEKGHPIGRSGMTGLAGGDHLHFGIYLGTQFVNPVEWWDQGWINDNILNKAALP
ncbi:MAG: M23 family metallopeptidase [Syntrophales bacterium]|jgi:murein DD-endopeptidase MepM/ murein hydrolase activator NlpD|nr:M23 family metallopeptidase [Syntrophales bacterium]MCK9527442.1 M23 family metallopeptidase [Syntrophales bacterium]MDX9921546.1 M23 family metallopeptidase [Syntrophales bacterium]